MKSLFIINPSSGRQNIRTSIERIIGKLVMEHICEYNEVFYTKQKDDAYQRAILLKANDYDFIVAVGGDGTVNEVIGGIIESGVNIPLAIIPAGTVNDFATYLQLPKSVDRFVKMIQAFDTKKVDVGRIGHQYFANVVAGGAFSDISYRVPKDKKARFGPLAYYIEGALAIPDLFTTHLNLSINANGKHYDEKAILFMVSNTKSVGGFTTIASKAEISDGLFDVIIIRKCEFTDLVALSKDILLNKHLDSPFVNFFQTNRVEIDCDKKDMVVDLDGEIGPNVPVIIENIPQALNILVLDKEKK